MKTEKPIIEALTGFYLAADAAYMPTDVDTDAGYFIEKEPVRRFNAFDPNALASLLTQSLSVANTIIPAPKMAPQDLVLAPYLGISTQKELEQKTVYVAVKKLNTGFKIVSLAKNSDGTADRKGPKAIDMVLPRETTYEQLATAIIEHLKSRKDLPNSQ